MGLRLGGMRVELDVGGVHQIAWPDIAALRHQMAHLARGALPVVRFAGGALIVDLSLHDNLMLEPMVHPALVPGGAAQPAGRAARGGRLASLERLFAEAGCPLQHASWRSRWAPAASPRELLQVRVGRAWMADLDVLVVDAEAWNDAVLPRQRFSRSFVALHPWRVLVWASAGPGQAADSPAQGHAA